MNKQVWVRLGGYITVSEEDHALLKVEDRTVNAEAIVLESFKKHGFLVCGDSYSPDDHDTSEWDEWDFDMSSVKLVFKEVSPETQI